MEKLIENIPWIALILFLIWICYRLWKAGKYRDPGQENTYHDAMRNKCPYSFTEGSELSEFIKSIRKPVSDKQVMILSLQFNKRILNKARWFEPGRKLRAVRAILDALNYLEK